MEFFYTKISAAYRPGFVYGLGEEILEVVSELKELVDTGLQKQRL